MGRREYQRDLRAAKKQLEDLLRHRQEMEQKIAQIQLKVHHLEGLCRDLDQIDAKQKEASSRLIHGLTQEISKTLEENILPLSAKQVMEKMSARGFDFRTYSNPLASVHTVLQRLVKAQKVKVVTKEKGKKNTSGFLRWMGLWKGLSVLRKDYRRNRPIQRRNRLPVQER